MIYEKRKMRGVILGAESMAPKNSGIGRVARLMARVLDEISEGSGIQPQGLGLSDPRRYPLDWRWAKGCGGSRAEYVARVHGQLLNAHSALYDSLSMARAHFLGPGRFRSALSWMHGIDVWERARREHLSAARRIPFLLTNSYFTRERAARLHKGLERARVCWLGTETDQLPADDREVRKRPPVVLILARMDYQSAGSPMYKGHRELIDVWPAVVDRVPEARLIIAGSGPAADEIENLARCSTASSSIEFTGYVPEAQLENLWRQATVFAMPSRGEGFGLAYIEAMRHGLPVVASKQDAGQEINLDGVTGFNVNLDIPRDLSEVLIALLSNQEHAWNMGEAGRIRWLNNFTFSHFKKRFLELIIHENLLPPCWLK